MDLSKYRSKLIGNEDERAVSPVIGVILMVAITVILAAVIAAFVLDIGDLDDSAPNAQFNWEATANGADVTLTSGENIDWDTIEFHNGGQEVSTGDITGDGGSEWTAGQTVEITGADDDFSIIFVADGSSAIISEYEV